MSPLNFQIEIINHNYETDSNLVYKKNNKSFYSVSSTKRLNSAEYEFSDADITKRIHQMIQEHQAELDKGLLAKLEINLQKRIHKLQTAEKGFLGIFTFLFYLFNPQSKVKLEEQKKTLETLRKTINDSTNSDVHAQIDDPKTHNHVQKCFESEIDSQSRLDSENSSEEEDIAPEKFPSFSVAPPPSRHPIFGFPLSSQDTTSSQLLEELPRRPNLHQGLLAGLTKPPLLRSASENFKKSSSLEQNTGAKKTPLPRKNETAPSIQRITFLPKLISKEPDPPLLSTIHYRQLTDDELTEEITLIENYMNELTTALIPLQELNDSYTTQEKELEEHASHLQDLKTQQRRCEANLKVIHHGVKEKRVVSLFYINDKDISPIPFYPHELKKEIIKKEPDLEKKYFYDCLDIVKAQDVLEQLIDEFKRLIIQIQSKEADIHNQLEVLQSKCKKTYKIDIQTLKEGLQKKKKEREELSNQKKLRETVLKKRDSDTIQPAIKPKKMTLTAEILQDFPLLTLLKDLPQGALFMLKNELRMSQEISKIIEEFNSRIYGKLFPEKPGN